MRIRIQVKNFFPSKNNELSVFRRKKKRPVELYRSEMLLIFFTIKGRVPKVARIGLIFFIKFESETLIRIEILGWIHTANPEPLITSSLLWFMGSPFA